MRKAFSVFVFGDYQRFIPLYVFSIKRNYPDADIIIFYFSKLSESVKDYLKDDRKIIYYENFFSEHEAFKNYPIRGGGGLKLLRFFVPGHFFLNYDIVYFGDVDVFYLKEEQSLFDFHYNQAIKCGLPFSNKVRRAPHNKLTKRLTGLHFIMVKDYYKKIDPIIAPLLKNKELRDDFLSKITRDEEFLYKINLKAFNFNPEAISKNKRPMHGFHLGVLRHVNMPHPDEFKNAMISKNEVHTQLLILSKDQEFLNILSKFDCIECYRILNYLEITLPWKFYYKYGFKYKSNKLIKRILNKLKLVLKINEA